MQVMQVARQRYSCLYPQIGDLIVYYWLNTRLPRTGVSLREAYFLCFGIFYYFPAIIHIGTNEFLYIDK